MALWTPARRRLAGGCAAVAVSLCAAAAGPSPAAAAHNVQFGLTDDAWLLNGPGTLDSRVQRLAGLGVQVVRFTLNWNQIARTQPADATDPTDPAYNWTAADAVVDSLRAHGIGVVLQLLGTPSWANGGRGPNVAPTSTTTFGAFAEAAARRYSWVKRWLVWNEPNQVRWLRPTSPLIYTIRLLNPAYRAIHTTIAGAEVAGGATAPRGSTGGVSPITWILGMHAAHARLDAYAHNPYPLDPKVETPLTGGCGHCQTLTMATIGRLVRLVETNFGRAGIWLTEYGYQTNPPDHVLGVTPSTQARYLGEADFQAYRTPRVEMLIQYLYEDEPEVSRFQSGLVRVTGARKPAYAAFELPLVETNRVGSTTTLWGQLRAPGTGSSARLERRTPSGWAAVATLTAGLDGYVTWHGRLTRGSRVRLDAGSLAGAEIVVR